MRSSILRSAGIMVFLCLLSLCSTAVADSVQDSINLNGTPTCCAWGGDSVGWSFTANSTYTLTGVFTRFSSTGFSPSQTVGLEFRDGGTPAGTLLASGSFTGYSNSGIWSGTSVAPVSITAGQTYFVGFTGVYYLGPNASNGLYGGGNLYFGGGPICEGNWSCDPFGSNFGGYYPPILRFDGTEANANPVPEPGSLALLGSGLLGLAGAVRRKLIA